MASGKGALGVPKFANGALVRIRKSGDSRKFLKSHIPNYYDDIYTIVGGENFEHDFRYSLKSGEGETLRGTFSEFDLQRVENDAK
jgi:hypothetical protein